MLLLHGRILPLAQRSLFLWKKGDARCLRPLHLHRTVFGSCLCACMHLDAVQSLRSV